MDSKMPLKEELKDLSIDSLGEATYSSPLNLKENLFVDDSCKILCYADSAEVLSIIQENEVLPMFESAGPRKKFYFNPSEINCGIVTCGGLCPGINDVIRSITLTLLIQYNVKKVLGFRYGYKGLTFASEYEPMELVPENVEGIQHEGGSILGTSRGPQDLGEMTACLEKNNISILFAIGGDGTFRGAHALAQEIKKRELKIAVIGVPKTIDNDIYGSEVSFGFGTSVEEASKSIACAHEEAKSALNGIGLVKLMGRDSGFIAASASLANSDVNFCLVPEVPFHLEGENGFLKKLEERLIRKEHAVIVVAEGAGQNLVELTGQKDESGNLCHGNIGDFLKTTISTYLNAKKVSHTVKYINPSYMIRSCPANARDSIFCLLLGDMAVHAGMAGKTDMFVGYWNHHFTHVPFSLALDKRKKVNPDGIIWQSLQAITEHVE